MELYPWQRLVIDSWWGRDEDGYYASMTCGLTAPRQNGKNGVLEAREVPGMIFLGERFLHTAHEVKTARKHFKRMLHYFDNKKLFPELFKEVEDIRLANGQEAILLKNGGSFELSARSKGAGRGFSDIDIVVFDEAQFLTDSQLEATLFAMSATEGEDPQMLLTGTAPGPDVHGEVFPRIRTQAIKGETDDTSWHEWSVSEVGDIHDRKRWYAVNPSLGLRIKERTIANESRKASEDGFARERLNWWRDEDDGTAALIKPKAWSSLAVEDDEVPSDGTKVYAVKFSPDGATASLVVALRSDDKVHLELLEHWSMSEGTSWLVDWLVERKSEAAQIVIEGKSYSQTIIDRLRAERVSKRVLQKPSTDDVKSASAMLLDAVLEKSITHSRQDLLDAAALNVQKRLIGRDGGFGFNPVDPAVDITAFEAASLAYRSVMTTKRRPGRKQEVDLG